MSIALQSILSVMSVADMVVGKMAADWCGSEKAVLLMPWNRAVPLRWWRRIEAYLHDQLCIFDVLVGIFFLACIILLFWAESPKILIVKLFWCLNC